MSKASPTFVDRFGRTWPGPPSIDVHDPAAPTLFSSYEVTDVDVAKELVQIRMGGAAFTWIDPSSGPHPDQAGASSRRIRKPRDHK